MPRLATYRAVDAAAPAGARCRSAFTLIELMVVTVLIISLAGLALAGMGVARQRAKIDKTKSTIRKLHEIIVPHYESYIRRRVPLPTGLASNTAIARERLQRIRTLTLYEMPDSWADVATDPATALGGLPSYAHGAATLSYAGKKFAVSQQTGASPSNANGTAECLFMIVSRGVGDTEVLQQFREDEIGDTDGDKAEEFVDAWGSAIEFVRWPAGAHLLTPPSPIQPADGSLRHDPFDPQRVDAGPGYALVPLIVSPGPDRLANLAVTPDAGWTAVRISSPQGLLTITATNSQMPLLIGGPFDPSSSAARDNITNHDLTTK